MGIIQKITCDHCGALHEVTAKDQIISCDYCDSSFFIQQNGGDFIQAEQKFYFLNQHYITIDCQHYRYDYGVKKEWLVVDSLQQRYILTQEDEIYSLVKKCSCNRFLSLNYASLLPNTQIEVDQVQWLVTERCSLTTKDNVQLDYVYLTTINAKLLVLIFKDDGIECRKGHWLDPFEISF